MGLSFSDVPERLEVPFSAVRGFYDPSVHFELEFDVTPPDAGQEAMVTQLTEAEPEPPAKKAAEKAKPPAAKAAAAEDKEKAEKDKSGADVVSLDAFRKK